MEAQGVESFAAITQEHIDFFRAYGYLVIRHAFTTDDVEATKAALLDLIDGKQPGFRGIQFETWARGRLGQLSREEKQDSVRKLMWFVNYDERFQRMAHHAELLALLRKLLGDEPDLFQDQALLKPPRGGREKPWHQDKAYFNVQVDSPVVGVWIALDEATIHNGCMHVIPGSHNDGPVPHFRRRDWQICDTWVKSSADVVVPLPPGGCLLFDGLLHHGTPANDSDQRRRAVQFHYTVPGVIKVDAKARLAIFGSEGKDVTC